MSDLSFLGCLLPGVRLQLELAQADLAQGTWLRGGRRRRLGGQRGLCQLARLAASAGVQTKSNGQEDEKGTVSKKRMRAQFKRRKR